MSDRFQLGEFWLAKRADQASEHWQITWYDQRKRQTRQRSTGTADFEQAKVRLAEHYVAQGQRRDEPASAVLIEHLLMRYYHQHASQLASAEYALYAIDYWRRFWGADTVADMSMQRLEQFQGWLAGGTRRPMSPATVNRVLDVGRAALKRAYKRQEIATVPHIPRVKPGARKRLYRATQADMAALLNAAAPHVRKWLVGSIVTLGRPKAVLELSRPQIDLEHRRIDLNPPGRPQNHKLRPVVPMTDTAHYWLSGDWTGLWITYRDKPLASIRMGFERARKRTKLPATVTPYTIRRTLSTELRRRGVPPWEIAGFLGHTARDYETTELYAEYAPDYLGAAAKTIDAYCGELQGMVDFELVRTRCVPEPKPAEGKILGKAGRREWDRTTDHHDVNVRLIQGFQQHRKK